ncbi:uncharacterized protein LOC132630734 isoform X1 [Lycium barbarum]|uniref:uncharacterized protein LOC132630734 isoform X1 n=1 Tax=Lycium barbarum TaxID=112863 RepID=UPI00293EE421|nr:uncharacterized protein LOC132630734 isoform X1 [Lycium barbarum]XP_060202286.1 uncharacterized protein LOC132630734 isoform X1 [Lycium barbarum]XP_060202287.1 uncharacterized protein LOC132630734 isoform X1 [Lycium barbarum]XP_060202288.1 uncharacterized protein LOC132630734 isoform X1 [Lycium barbarum]XP_060202289.1 uncharacterized protein LOC132630734 isoform X1 [Lycium barbarum]XP_060202290.1 uncharacterized protein LOC132630734 isoform X1 [Lycium barbarum]XP_060202291.1 uncharacterize
MHNMIQDAYGMHSDFESGNHVEEDPNEEASHFFEQLKDTSRPLCDGSPHSQLSIAVRLISIKADWNVPQGAMDAVISLIRELVDPNLEILVNYYKAKRLVSKFGLSSYKIDCYENGCMLYYKDDVGLESCKFCGRARFKRTRSGKRVAFKAMHYLPLIPRLERLYTSNSSASHMRWHSENRRPPGVMCHPSDGEAWKHFDRTYPDFAAEPRNIRLGLCSDRFTPHSVSAAPYSCWPVFLTPYNLPPELCMTSPYIFLNCIIPVLRNPKVLIDVYLQPLIDELKLSWVEGVDTFDVSRRQNFNLRATLMWTINDFPAYGMLSGWMTAGKLACPYCMENTKSFTLKYGHKNSWFDCHCQFLPIDHEFRSMENAFRKNIIERNCPPPRLSGEDIWERVQNFPKVTEEAPYKFDGYGSAHNWTKQSIFWELPYWKDNLLRHNLDVMHIEKNYFDNLFNIVMDVKGKTKDNAKARQKIMQRQE